MMTWMIYGANGYTGQLIAEEAKRRGLRPILAGRSAPAIEALARRLDLPARVFTLDDPTEIARHLEGVALVLHCAGPFSATSSPMLDACLLAGTHYLDITGEIAVFEAIHKRHAELVAAGIVAIPGVGFDVVPSDSLAAMLKRALPTATRLTLAMRPRGGVSPGTAKTSIEGAAAGGMIREDGQLKPVPLAYKSIWVPFDDTRPALAVTIPWGDVATAFYTTSIPNIEVYLHVSPAMLRFMKLVRHATVLLRAGFAQRLLKRLIEARVQGPNDAERTAGSVVLWGEVEDAQGHRVAMRMRTPDGYVLTVESSLAIAERVLQGQVAPGAWTPALAFGPDFVLSLQGVTIETIPAGGPRMAHAVPE